MRFKFILYVMIYFVVLVSSACGTTATPYPTRYPTRNPIISSDFTPRPTANLKFPGYEQFDCDYINTPADFSDKECYWINTSENAFGIVLYNGSEINGIDVFMDADASFEVGGQGGLFIGFVASRAGWDIEDTTNASKAMSTMQVPGIEQFGEVLVSLDVIDNGKTLLMMFTRH